MIGTLIGPYQVIAKLGQGGMGEVYRARDDRLGRDVAIKVLPASVAADPERLARFEREARLLASLSHANIAQVYGLEHADRRFLVMELAPGEDLTSRIARGPIPLDEALPIATQITLALEAAHERAIVHRDLKPANVKVSAEGAVKVLDFGLAKALAPAGASDSADLVSSPTLTAQATAAGIILGTAAYMSPEQARGRDADKRADIWAFGVVLFEMLTGARLFHGETISDTLAAVLRQGVPWARLPAGLPSELTRVLRRCLERDRRNRLHDIADARIVLEEIARGGATADTPGPVPAARPAGRARRLAGAAAAAAVFALGIASGRWMAPGPPASGAGTIRLVVPTPPGVTTVRTPAVAPNGRSVVFVGRSSSMGSRLYLQRLDQSAPVAIDRTDGAALPGFSADGRWITFRRRDGLEKIAVDGGEPLSITDASLDGPGQVWLETGRIVFSKSWLSPLSAVSAEGGEVRAVSTLDTGRGEIGHWYPSALPGGRHVLVTIWLKAAGLNDAEVAVLDLATGRHRVLFKGAEARYLAPGFIVFFRAGAYHAVRFDPETHTLAGEPVRVLDDAHGNSPQGEALQADLAGDTFAYLSGPLAPMRELVWLASGGRAEPLPFPARAFSGATVTPDGARVAAAVLDAGRHTLRILDLERRTEDTLDLPGSNWGPVWHPDGRRLAFRSMRKGDFDTYWKDVTTSGAAEPLLVTDQDESPDAFLPGGRGLIVRQSVPSGEYLPRLMMLDPPRAPENVLPFTISGLAVSRDGQFVALLSARSGSNEVYVKPVAGDAAALRVSTGGGIAVAWSRDGRELLYLRPPEIIAVAFRSEGGRFQVVGERVWSRVEGNYADSVFDVGPDGRVLVALSRDQAPREIRVVVNWQEEIARKLGP